jgi:nicotinamide-nucleotide amidase
MRRDQAIADKIRHIFESRGRVMSANNLRQADIPVGAHPIAQMPGTAPGLVCPLGDKVIYAVPGVPAEMREMVAGTILPDLRRRMGQTAVIRSRVLRTWGASESGVAEIVAERVEQLDKQGNPTIAFQASGIDGIKVRIVAKCDDEAAAKRVLDSEEALMRGLLGDLIFGIDEQSMELVVLDALRKRAMTVAATETLTGGILSSRMSALDPAMQTFRGASVLPEASSGGPHRGPPEQRAGAAAAEARERFGTHVGLAAIVPEASEGHAPGAVFLGVAIESTQHGEKIMLTPDRKRMREFAVISLLNLLRKKLAS